MEKKTQQNAHTRKKTFENHIKNAAKISKLFYKCQNILAKPERTIKITLQIARNSQSKFVVFNTSFAFTIAGK